MYYTCNFILRVRSCPYILFAWSFPTGKNHTHSNLGIKVAIVSGWLPFCQKCHEETPWNGMICGLLHYPTGNMHVYSLLQWAFERKVQNYYSHNAQSSLCHKKNRSNYSVTINCTPHYSVMYLTIILKPCPSTMRLFSMTRALSANSLDTTQAFIITAWLARTQRMRKLYQDVSKWNRCKES